MLLVTAVLALVPRVWRGLARLPRRTLGIYDTWPGLIIPYMSFTLPLAIWTLSAFFREIPWEMEQAAQVDGANAWQRFWYVTLPMLRPVAMIAVIIQLIDRAAKEFRASASGGS